MPDVPAENYWYRRHLAVYEWIAARCNGLEVVDMACGEGYGTDVLARRARGVTGVDANPEAHEHARLKYTRPGVRFVRDLVENYRQEADAVVFLQTIEHVERPEEVLMHFRSLLKPGGAVYLSTPNVLTLAPPGADKSDNPFHLREYRAEEFRALCAIGVRARGDVRALPRPQAPRARAGPACRLGSRARGAGNHQAVLRPLHPRHRRPRLRPAHRRARARARLRSGPPLGDLEMSSRRGALALVLHTHMPYVEGFGTWPFGEEWLWEAVACVYLPLLEVLDGAPVTVGLTPVLCDQLEAMRGEAGDRYLRFLREVRHEVHEEDAAGLARTGEPELAAEVRRAAGDYERAADEFERRGRDLVGAFRDLDGVELWTSSATHAVLPLLATRAGLRLQVATGENSHRRRYGDWGGGFWLPECAYDPGLERELADLGVRTFCVDQTGPLGLGAPEHLTPVALSAGTVAVPVDWQTVQLVWSEDAGYPGRGAYRDYHRRTVHDLRPWNNAGGHYDAEARRGGGPEPRAAPSWTAWWSAPATAVWCAARSTPSCSATGGTRDPHGWRRS